MSESKQVIKSKSYKEFLVSLKSRIEQAQIRMAVSVNSQLVELYWSIGKGILERQHSEGWGAKVIDELSADLKKEFPDVKGFSSRNLKYMRSFAEAYPDFQFVQEVLAQIPWYHNIALLDKLDDIEERLWYAKASLEYGWSRNILVHQIESRLKERQGKALVNFSRTLPESQSELVRETLKNPYVLDFVMLKNDVKEKELEDALVKHITKFLLELGAGFAFVGRQYHLEIAKEDFYIDLLFYHVVLKAYVAIELKTTEFKPEYAGKMNFYLSALDDILKRPEDNPTIGLILCKSHSKLKVEYSLKDTNKPLGVASYELTKSLPEQLQKALPSIEELEQELLEVDEEL